MSSLLPDCDCYYLSNYYSTEQCAEILTFLETKVPLQRPHLYYPARDAASVIIPGEFVIATQSRQTAWFGIGGQRVQEGREQSDILPPRPWNSLMLRLREDVERTLTEVLGEPVKFNGCLVGSYAPNEGVGFHDDRSVKLGEDPLVASLSFGATRTIQLRSGKSLISGKVIRGEVKKLSLPLETGSLMIMGRGMQARYKHGIIKDPTALGIRWNLTFRDYSYDEEELALANVIPLGH